MVSGLSVAASLVSAYRFRFSLLATDLQQEADVVVVAMASLAGRHDIVFGVLLKNEAWWMFPKDTLRLTAAMEVVHRPFDLLTGGTRRRTVADWLHFPLHFLVFDQLLLRVRINSLIICSVVDVLVVAGASLLRHGLQSLLPLGCVPVVVGNVLVLAIVEGLQLQLRRILTLLRNQFNIWSAYERGRKLLSSQW